MKVIHDALTRDFSCMFIRLFIYLCNSFTSGRCTRVIFTIIVLALSLAVVHCTVVFHLAGWTSGAKRTDFSSDTRSLAPRVELLPTQPRWGFRVKVQGCKAQGNGFVVRVLGLRTVIGLGFLV